MPIAACLLEVAGGGTGGASAGGTYSKPCTQSSIQRGMDVKTADVDDSRSAFGNVSAIDWSSSKSRLCGKTAKVDQIDSDRTAKITFAAGDDSWWPIAGLLEMVPPLPQASVTKAPGVLAVKFDLASDSSAVSDNAGGGIGGDAWTAGDRIGCALVTPKPGGPTALVFTLNGEPAGGTEIGVVPPEHLSTLRPLVTCGAGTTFNFVEPLNVAVLSSAIADELPATEKMLVMLDLAATTARALSTATAPPNGATSLCPIWMRPSPPSPPPLCSYTTCFCRHP